MRPDHERLRALLTDTITCLCRNGLKFNENICVQGLLGITLDNNDVFVVHINETLTTGHNNAADTNIPVISEIQSIPTRPLKRHFPREGLKAAKKYSWRSSYHSSRLPSSSRGSAGQAGDRSAKDLVDDPTELPDNTVQLPEDWTTQIGGTGNRDASVDEAITIKSEPDESCAQFEQLLELDAGLVNATYGNNQESSNIDVTDLHFRVNERGSHVPSVVSGPVQKRSRFKRVQKIDSRGLVSRQFDNSALVAASTSQHSVSQHIHSGGYIGEGYESSQSSGWNPRGHLIAVTPPSQGGTTTTYLGPSSSSAVDSQDYNAASGLAVPYRLNHASGAKSFVCFCGKSFFHKPNFYRHRRQAHPEYHYSFSRSNKFVAGPSITMEDVK